MRHPICFTLLGLLAMGCRAPSSSPISRPIVKRSSRIPSRSEWPLCDLVNRIYGITDIPQANGDCYVAGIKSADADLNHLYPPFKEKIIRALDQAHLKTGVPWRVYEGYRSQARQDWLWASGRTRPGKVVTWTRKTSYHGASIAVDAYPTAGITTIGIEGYRIYRECYLAEGLDNPAWTKSDLGHCQLSDPVIRQKALAWVRAGFRDPALPPPDIKILIDGELIPDAHAYLLDGRVYAALRPVADALDLAITATTAKNATLTNDQADFSIGLSLKSGVGYSPVGQFPCDVGWDGKSRTVFLRKGK